MHQQLQRATGNVATGMTDASNRVHQAYASLIAHQDPKIAGKVPAQALSAFGTMQRNRAVVSQHVTALQQCLLPCSADIISSATAFLQLVMKDRSLMCKLVQSEQLSQLCSNIASALSSAQEGYEALGSDLLELQYTLTRAEHKVMLDLQAARKHINKKMRRRQIACVVGPAAAGTAAFLGAAAASLLLFQPLGLIAARSAAKWAAKEADNALARAEGQLARTEDITQYCSATSKQLQHVVDVVAATRCVAELAGFFSSLAATVQRAGSTAGRAEQRITATEDLSSEALMQVLQQQIGKVVTAGISYTTTLTDMLQTSGPGGESHADLKPAYIKVAAAAYELKGHCQLLMFEQ